MSSRIVSNLAWWGLCGVWVLCLLAAAERPAHAYVDPGSGLLFIQAAGSTLAGIGFLLRRRLREIIRRFTHRSDPSA